MDQETLSLLEFPAVLEIVQAFAHSGPGKTYTAALQPSRNPAEIENRLARLQDYACYLRQEGRLDFHDLEDLRLILGEVGAPGQVLKPEDFLTVLKVLKLGRQVKTALGKSPLPLLVQDVKPLPLLEELSREIERTIDPSGAIRDEADPELRTARRKQARAREKVQEHLHTYFTGTRARFLSEQPYITLRNDRYVIPVRSEHVRDVPGVVHGSSSSGATLFVEPLSAIPLNNEYLHYLSREQEVIRKILGKLSDLLRTYRSECRELVGKLAQMDALFAGAEFSLRYDCAIPRLSRDNVLRLHRARHPLLVEKLGNDRVVPISVQLSSDGNALVISGPNAGGKTVALKTVGLLCLMAQSGLPIPASDAEVPVFHQVLADIGDRQSISQQLSTFSAHVLRMKQMMEELDPPSLILLDELGTGTDPVYGSVLGIALIDFFRRRPTMVVATTHHQAIKAFAATTRGVENASVRLDPKSLRPTYELEFGVAGESSALEIAEQLGLPGDVVTSARRLLTEKDLQAERYLERLREELELLSQKRHELAQEIEALKEKEKKREVEFDRREEERRRSVAKMLDEWTSDFRAETRKFIGSLKDRFEAARARKESVRKEAVLKEAFRRRMATKDEPVPAETQALSAQDWVYHSLFRKRGRIVDLKDGEVVVEIDGKKVTASLDQLQKVDPEPPARKLPSNVTLNVSSEAAGRELNLIGCTVEEALARADKFLDRAFLSSLTEVRIIHGFGTGKLKAALSDFLKQHPHVQDYRVEGGATVVALRE